MFLIVFLDIYFRDRYFSLLKTLKKSSMPLFFQGLNIVIPLYIGVSQKTLLLLQAVQKAAARMLIGSRKREHITPVLFSLHWLPVRFQIEFKLVLFVFKSLNVLAPPYLEDLL